MQPADTQYTETNHEITATAPNLAHALPMSNEQVERELSDLSLSIETDYTGTVNRKLATSLLRQAFTLGQDNGKAIVMRGASALLADSVADAQTMQLGRSLAAVLAWSTAREGRMFSGLRATFAQVMLADDEPGSDGYHFHFEHGSSSAEALSKMATWCNEHTIAHPVAK